MLGTRLQHIANTAFPWPTFKPVHEIVGSASSSPNTSSEEQDRIVNEKVESKAACNLMAPTVKFVIGNEDSESEVDDDAITSPTAVLSPQSSSTQPKVPRQSTVSSSGSSSSLLSPLQSPQHQASGSEGLRRSSSTMFLEANPYRKYVEKCMHSKGLRKTFDKIVEVIKDVMARVVCAMDEDEHHHHNKSVPMLEEHCMELQRQLFLSPYVPNPADMFIRGPATNSSGAQDTSSRSVPFHHLSWSGRIWCMGLPGLPNLFWFLSSVPVQLVCECLVLLD